MGPVLSIVTPAYEHGAFIEDTLRSVCRADVPAVEHVVVDGGSSDETTATSRRTKTSTTSAGSPNRTEARSTRSPKASGWRRATESAGRTRTITTPTTGYALCMTRDPHSRRLRGVRKDVPGEGRRPTGPTAGRIRRQRRAAVPTLHVRARRRPLVIPHALEERGHVGHRRPSDADSSTNPYVARSSRLPRAIRRLGPPSG